MVSVHCAQNVEPRALRRNPRAWIDKALKNGTWVVAKTRRLKQAKYGDPWRGFYRIRLKGRLLEVETNLVAEPGYPRDPYNRCGEWKFECRQCAITTFMNEIKIEMIESDLIVTHSIQDKRKLRAEECPGPAIISLDEACPKHKGLYEYDLPTLVGEKPPKKKKKTKTKKKIRKKRPSYTWKYCPYCAGQLKPDWICCPHCGKCRNPFAQNVERRALRRWNPARPGHPKKEPDEELDNARMSIYGKGYKPLESAKILIERFDLDSKLATARGWLSGGIKHPPKNIRNAIIALDRELLPKEIIPWKSARDNLLEQFAHVSRGSPPRSPSGELGRMLSQRIGCNAKTAKHWFTGEIRKPNKRAQEAIVALYEELRPGRNPFAQNVERRALHRWNPSDKKHRARVRKIFAEARKRAKNLSPTERKKIQARIDKRSKAIIDREAFEKINREVARKLKPSKTKGDASQTFFSKLLN